MNLDQFDIILYFDGSEENTFENVDQRNINRKLMKGSDEPLFGKYANVIDPKLYASFSFGKQLKNDINNMGKDYSCEITDFGQEVVCTVTHSDTVTGRSASKTFLIVFTNTKGDAYVKSNSNKWRSISGLGQAASYIRSVCSSLSSITQNKM